MSNPENYIDAPTNNVAAVIAVAPKRAASKLGAFSRKTTHTSVNALLLRPRYNGYAKEYCESCAAIESGIRNGQPGACSDENAKPNSPAALIDQPDASPRIGTAEPKSVAQPRRAAHVGSGARPTDGLHRVSRKAGVWPRPMQMLERPSVGMGAMPRRSCATAAAPPALASPDAKQVMCSRKWRRISAKRSPTNGCPKR